MTNFLQNPILKAENLIVIRNGKRVLEIEKIQIQAGETLSIIGPNGAGKSTLMLTLATLLKRASGDIYFNNQIVRELDAFAFRRKIALVLQDPLLFDMSVYDNVAAGLRFRGLPRKVVKTQVEDWLVKLGISHLRDRSARRISGGEAQRVSLARAFAIQPRILLLDEPFRALDAPTKTRLVEDFQALLSDTKMTTLFVTHDMDEALLLGDRIAVILDGQLRQIGSPEAIFNNPVDLDVGGLVGVETVLPGKVIQNQNGNVTVDVCGLQINALGQFQIGREVLLLLRPEDITLWKGENLPVSSARNRISGIVRRFIPQGPLMKIIIECWGDQVQNCVEVVSLITRTSALEMELVEGTEVTLTFKASAIHLIPR